MTTDETAVPPRHTITQQWLDAYRGPSGAHSPRQLDVLGFAWPPPAGWMAAAIGRTLSDYERRRFEQLASDRR
jgi:hypothetical protein